MSKPLKKKLMGKVLARERVFKNGQVHEASDPPWIFWYHATADEEGNFPTFEEGLPPSLEYFGPVTDRDPIPEERDTTIPKQPMAPGEGAPQATPPDRATRILSAYQMLDPENDAHWTRDGRPRIAVLSEFMGDRISEADVKMALPNMRRPVSPTPADMGVEEEATD